MTWVIGMTSPLGYGALISDVRVTLSDGTTRDVLQKAYQVGDFVVAGFSGSVRIGFELLIDLRRFLTIDPPEAGSCWLPRWVAEQWSPRARTVFLAAPERERASGCSILFVGAEPREDSYFKSAASVCVLRAPAFKPVVIDRGWRFHHIGSGAGINRCKANVRYYFSGEGEKSRLLAEQAGGLDRLLASSLGRDAINNPALSVSNHMHVFTVRVGSVKVSVNNMSRHDQDGSVTHFRMPPVATSLKEFERMIGSASADSARA